MIADLRGKRVFISAAATDLSRALVEAFTAHGAECSQADPTHLDEVLESGARIDAMIHDGGGGMQVKDFESYRREDLLAAITGSTWPLFEGLRRIKAAQGSYPRYAIGLSSPASIKAVAGADFAAAGDAVMETLCRYATYRLIDEDIRINVIRFPRDEDGPTRCADVAQAAVALCSGWMDAVRGQVVTVDRGAGFTNTVMHLYDEYAAPGAAD